VQNAACWLRASLPMRERGANRLVIRVQLNHDLSSIENAPEMPICGTAGGGKGSVGPGDKRRLARPLIDSIEQVAGCSNPLCCLFPDRIAKTALKRPRASDGGPWLRA
jgi:hypothetical protein